MEHIRVWQKRTRWAWKHVDVNGEVLEEKDGFADHAEAIRDAMGPAQSTDLPLYIGEEA